ncbi:uncharacterized protein CLUP02_08472 [Colletotrichum lupini]|uniref:Uncharacterized protein n=1 Tax=Colletotrichum lupini TaxID=145971 RepID=A0A9Q8SUU4_9PEZI|nr:uncharacterized protein CLUP02_08472 [Colletotrichum lupini]UQC82982.1 hypothetical protein CLUP02_08472 [Colletotrichum lupini]
MGSRERGDDFPSLGLMKKKSSTLVLFEHQTGVPGTRAVYVKKGVAWLTLKFIQVPGSSALKQDEGKERPCDYL